MMSEMGLKLSAYLDGELPAAEAASLGAQLETDAGLRAELDALMGANAVAKAEFGAMLDLPLPLSLARAMDRAPASQAAGTPRRMPVWASLAASLALLAVGAGGGYVAGQQTQIAAARDWVADVADYHALYAAQTRHLVEVPASESDHIETWFTKEIGTPVHIPDLTTVGLTFEGGRLLVADGKPVGQLMYRDAAGQVVALCFIASDKPATDQYEARDLGGFDSLVWGTPGKRLILIGPKGYPTLRTVAEAAETV
jgi:anti-sigma factor RsiW